MFSAACGPELPGQFCATIPVIQLILDVHVESGTG